MINKYKTCSFIGHREIELNEEFLTKLKLTIEKLIVEHGVKRFLFGSKSQFNDLCYEIVTNLKQVYLDIDRVVYTCKNESCILQKDAQEWTKIYNNFKIKDSLFVFEAEVNFKNKYSAGKNSYILRNRAMIDDSDICIIYYLQEYVPNIAKRYNSRICSYKLNSGTRIALDYIWQRKKEFINVVLT